MFLCLTGCSQMSPIEKVNESESNFEGAVYEGKQFYISNKPAEGEQYRIFHQGSTGFTVTSVLRKSATKRANKFCNKVDKGTEMYTISEHTASPPYILGNFPRIEIIFVCTPNTLGVGLKGYDKYNQLRKVKQLYDDGILNEEEFQQEKKRLLN